MIRKTKKGGTITIKVCAETLEAIQAILDASPAPEDVTLRHLLSIGVVQHKQAPDFWHGVLETKMRISPKKRQ